MTLLERIANNLGFIKQTEVQNKLSSMIQTEIEKVSAEKPSYTSDSLMQFEIPPAKKTTDFLLAYAHYVLRCVDARSKEVGNIKLHLYKRSGTEWKEIEEHALLELLYRVNPFTTQSMFFETSQSYKDLAGESFWLKLRDNKKNVKELWSLRPDWIEVLPDKKTFIKGYKYKLNNSSDPKEHVVFPKEDVLHFKSFNPTNPFRGSSLVKAVAVEIDAYDFSGEYNRNFFYNSAKPAGILWTENTLKEDVRRRLEEQWKAKYGGKENAFKTAILEGGLKWQDIGSTQKDMDFATLRTMSRDDILAIFQVPKVIIGITDDVNRANARESRAVFQEVVIDPLMRSLVGFLNEFLVPDFGEDLWLDYEPPYPSDQTQDLKYYESGIKNGWLTVNEVREREGLDLINQDVADSILLPNNLIAVKDGQIVGMPSADSSTGTAGVNPDSGGGGIGDNMNDNNDSNKQRKMHMTPPHRPLAEKVKEDIKKKVKTQLMARTNPEVAELFAKALGIYNPETTNKVNPKPTDSKKKDLKQIAVEWTEENKQKYWKMLTDNALNYEDSIVTKLNRLFTKQEAEVLRRLDDSDLGKSAKGKVDKGITSILFDETSETALFANLIVPLIKGLIKSTGKSVEDFLGVDTDFSDNLTIVQNYLDEFKDKTLGSVNRTTRDQIIDQLQQGLAAGEGSDDLTKRVKSVYNSARQSRAAIIARTETIRASNFATEQIYIRSKVVVAKKWLTALDERTCEWCAPMDGRIIPLGQNFFNLGGSFTGNEGGVINFDFLEVKNPPLHPNCRCTLIPVTETDI